MDHLLIINIMLLTAVQEHLSSKRKEMWKTIQIKANSPKVVQLILNMKVLWSSTYLMFDWAKRKKEVRNKFIMSDQSSLFFFLQCVDTFVDELRWEEQDSTKRDKIHELKLTSEEWTRVNTFLDLLTVCFVTL